MATKNLTELKASGIVDGDLVITGQAGASSQIFLYGATVDLRRSV